MFLILFVRISLRIPQFSTCSCCPVFRLHWMCFHLDFLLLMYHLLHFCQDFDNSRSPDLILATKPLYHHFVRQYHQMSSSYHPGLIWLEPYSRLILLYLDSYQILNQLDLGFLKKNQKIILKDFWILLGCSKLE
jgi:hypothetical protein